MEILKQLVNQTRYRHFVSLEQNKIILDKINSYKKYEIALHIIDLLDKKSLNYEIDSSVNIIVK